jgi:hypothetical protein
MGGSAAAGPGDVVVHDARGRPFRLADLPLFYLRWRLRRNWRLGDLERQAMRAEVKRRGREEAAPRPADARELDWDAIVSGWLRIMAMRYHPDRGGSDAAMQVVNDGAEELRRVILGELEDVA